MIKIILICAGLSLAQQGYAKKITLHYEATPFSVMFTDDREGCYAEYFSASQKTSKQDLKTFLLTDVAHYLLEDEMQWTSSSGDNISDIFHVILNTFKYDSYLYICDDKFML